MIPSPSGFYFSLVRFPAAHRWELLPIEMDYSFFRSFSTMRAQLPRAVTRSHEGGVFLGGFLVFFGALCCGLSLLFYGVDPVRSDSRGRKVFLGGVPPLLA